MKKKREITAIIEREGDGYVALCPNWRLPARVIPSKVRHNLIEAVELFLETADPSEVQRRLRSEIFITRLEVAFG